MYDKLRKLSATRIKHFIEHKIPFYKWHKTYIEWIKDELSEVEQELKDNNSVYLEDELWDILWNYLCLLHSLESEWKITSIDKVIERSYNKFTGRIWVNWDKWENWDEIKTLQKDKLKEEHNKKYNNGN